MVIALKYWKYGVMALLAVFCLILKAQNSKLNNTIEAYEIASQQAKDRLKEQEKVVNELENDYEKKEIVYVDRIRTNIVRLPSQSCASETSTSPEVITRADKDPLLSDQTEQRVLIISEADGLIVAENQAKLELCKGYIDALK